MRFTAFSARNEVTRVEAIAALLKALEDLGRLGLVVEEPLLLERAHGNESGPEGGLVKVKYCNPDVPLSAFYYTFGDDEQ